MTTLGWSGVVSAQQAVPGSASVYVYTNEIGGRVSYPGGFMAPPCYVSPRAEKCEYRTTAGKHRTTSECKVLGTEALSTQAGTFSTRLVFCKDLSTGTGASNPVHYTYWIDASGRVIKSEGSWMGSRPGRVSLILEQIK